MSSEISIAEFKKLKNKDQTEDQLRVQVCEYLKETYPHVIFTCDLSSGMNLGKKIGGMNTRLRSSRAIPDVFIAFPRHISGSAHYHGLWIELKRASARLQNGEIASTKKKVKIKGVTVIEDHHKEQKEMLRRLQNLSYRAEFACGFDEAKKLIDSYLS